MPVSYSGTAITWPDSSTTTSGWTGFKNRIINGAMMIDQRNAGASLSVGAGGYTVDRWAYYIPNSSSATIQQVSDAPTGFKNSLKFTAGTGVAVNNQNEIYQFIEGYNIADLGWGAAGAATVTLSFWVKCSLTGTFNCSLINNGSARSYVATYTINAADTWEQKSVTIAGDTSGTWLTTNGVGIGVVFSLGQSATYQTTANTWAAGDYKGSSGAVSVVATSGATFYITGVQLERGSTASSFEHVDYGRQLIQCQRYYEVQNLEYQLALYDSAETKFRWGRRPYAVVKRTTPSSAIKSGTIYYAVPGSNGYSADSNANITWYSLTDSFAAAQLRAAGRATPTGGNMYMIEGGIVAEFSAEF